MGSLLRRENNCLGCLYVIKKGAIVQGLGGWGGEGSQQSARVLTSQTGWAQGGIRNLQLAQM